MFGLRCRNIHDMQCSLMNLLVFLFLSISTLPLSISLSHSLRSQRPISCSEIRHDCDAGTLLFPIYIISCEIAKWVACGVDWDTWNSCGCEEFQDLDSTIVNASREVENLDRIPGGNFDWPFWSKHTRLTGTTYTYILYTIKFDITCRYTTWSSKTHFPN